jgi:hypothetical protein
MLLLLIITIIAGGISACSENEGAEQSPQPSAEIDSSGQEKSYENLTTEVWRAADNTISTWFTDGTSGESNGFELDNMTLLVGKNADGKDIVSLLRLPLKATWTVNEISEARLFLRVIRGEAPAFVNACLITQIWNDNEQADMLSGVINKTAAKKLEVQAESGGWISIPVTDYIKGWMNGEAQNYGLAIFGIYDDEEFVVVSGYGEEDDDYPYFKVSGAIGQRDLTFGKFGYTETPLPSALEDEGDNCLSYALRDTNMILISDLDADLNKMSQIYTTSGEDAVADYVAKSVENYVKAHRETLQISHFRRLNDFDSEIDNRAEYRIALRVGCKPIDGVADFTERGQFDYHFWLQLNDGRWAQKFPLDHSEIIPYTAPGLSPGKYDWDSASQWLPKFKNFYTSKVIYFAVTKDTDKFTEHKSADNYPAISY